MAKKIGGLGKGLDLIFTENNIENDNYVLTLKISEIDPNPDQPRSEFDSDSLKELAESIAKHGIIQPLTVKPTASGKYKIIAGERRFKAAKAAGLSEVPAIVKDLSDSQIMEVALVENLQREDLSPIEEAKGYKVLMQTYGFTQEEVSKSVGKSRPYITNSLRLLALPSEVLQKLSSKELSSGHARALLGLKNEEDILEIMDVTLKQGLNVRQLEELVKKVNFKEIEEIKSLKVIKKDAFFNKISSDLGKYLKRKVKIVSGRSKKGSVQIEFFGEEDLSNLYSILKNAKQEKK